VRTHEEEAADTHSPNASMKKGKHAVQMIEAVLVAAAAPAKVRGTIGQGKGEFLVGDKQKKRIVLNQIHA
jgi:hypothetical protein